MTTPLGPLPTGQAMRALRLTHRDQMNKLIGCGLTPVAETTPSGQRRLDPVAVLDLASWPLVLGPSGRPDLAVHLAPLQFDSNGAANQRTHAGFRVNAAAAGVTPQQAEDAWVGLWNCNPAPYVGSYLIGDVAGFVVAAATITGYQVINRLIRFDIAAAPPEILAQYMRHRITARRGGPFQEI